MLEIVGDDDIGPTEDGCGEDVAITEMVVQCRLKSLLASDGGLREGSSHSVEHLVEIAGLQMGAVFQDVAAGFFEDLVAPQDPVDTELCDGKENRP